MQPKDILAATTTAITSIDEARPLLNKARAERVSYHPSPSDWRDEVLYFLLPDRFSDGNTKKRAMLRREEIRNIRRMQARPGWDWSKWAESGKRWQGGTIKGISSELSYLSALGITSLWVGPIFKQRDKMDTYHGYGIQDFFEVDPRFGTKQDLLELVDQAHQKGIRIILDIIINHSGDNWGYLPPGSNPSHTAEVMPDYRPWPHFYGESSDPNSRWILAWRDKDQKLVLADNPAASLDRHSGVWPKDLMSFDRYTRAGKGSLAAGAIEDPHAEHKRSDFSSLKDFRLDDTRTLGFLTECFKYWIAASDCDGFRVDTIKHMALTEAQNFCGAIKEFADSIGKRNFLLIGEVAGGDKTQNYYLDNLAVMQRNLNAALDIGTARPVLSAVGKGLAPAHCYFDGFNKKDSGLGSHRYVGNRHISVLDDHDHVSGKKVRFSADIPDDMAVKDYQVVVPTAIQLFSLGIPCIYYGTEQAFAGPSQSQRDYLLGHGWGSGDNYGDRYLRETMFGPDHPRAFWGSHELEEQIRNMDQQHPGFGPFGTSGKHCFDTTSPAFVRLTELLRIRREQVALRVGRQYQRPFRLPGTEFQMQGAGEMIAWSRILDNIEALILVNPNGTEARGGDVLVSAELNPPGTNFMVIANTAEAAAQAEGMTYNGEMKTGSLMMARADENDRRIWLPIRNLAPCEVVVMMRQL